MWPFKFGAELGVAVALQDSAHRRAVRGAICDDDMHVVGHDRCPQDAPAACPRRFDQGMCRDERLLLGEPYRLVLLQRAGAILGIGVAGHNRSAGRIALALETAPRQENVRHMPARIARQGM